MIRGPIKSPVQIPLIPIHDRRGGASPEQTYFLFPHYRQATTIYTLSIFAEAMTLWLMMW